MEYRDEPVECLEVSALDQLLEIVHRIAQAFLERIHCHQLLRTGFAIREVWVCRDLVLGHDRNSDCEPYRILPSLTKQILKNSFALGGNRLRRSSTPP